MFVKTEDRSRIVQQNVVSRIESAVNRQFAENWSQYNFCSYGSIDILVPLLNSSKILKPLRQMSINVA
jgi:hypothetical protein